MSEKEQWLKWAMELQALSQSALYWCKDPYDIERFQRIREISAEIMAAKSGLDLETVKGLFCNETGYQTPKIDTRAAIIQNGKILLVQEKNGKWAMPGGWCDVGQTPADNTVKEAKEEAGMQVRVTRLVSVEDQDIHNFPPNAYKIIKLTFLCEPLGGEFAPNTETVASGWFPENSLPEPMANEKCTAGQVRLCFEAARSAHWETRFD
ncbi:MAG: NUDIX hydrolase N-terminal domain-containing protein [Clostridia bacterium]|nr:NUDIX hydrolase N-terminal domain-containing protein [Clostridia bacterium]